MLTLFMSQNLKNKLTCGVGVQYQQCRFIPWELSHIHIVTNWKEKDNQIVKVQVKRACPSGSNCNVVTRMPLKD